MNVFKLVLSTNEKRLMFKMHMPDEWGGGVNLKL